jgi:hypothetical protein
LLSSEGGVLGSLQYGDNLLATSSSKAEAIFGMQFHPKNRLSSGFKAAGKSPRTPFSQNSSER